MALYESKEIGIDESFIVNEVYHGSEIEQSVTAYSGGLYQLICGGLTDQNNDGTIDVYYKPPGYPQGVFVGFVSVPYYDSSLAAFGMKSFSVQMQKSSELVLKTTGTGAYKIFYVFQKIG